MFCQFRFSRFGFLLLWPPFLLPLYSFSCFLFCFPLQTSIYICGLFFFPSIPFPRRPLFSVFQFDDPPLFLLFSFLMFCFFLFSSVHFFTLSLCYFPAYSPFSPFHHFCLFRLCPLPPISILIGRHSPRVPFFPLFGKSQFVFQGFPE